MTAWKKLCLMACTVIVPAHRLHAMTNLTRNDPYPVYTTADPHVMLTREYRTELKEKIIYETVNEWIRFSSTMYRQRASVGTDINNIKYVNLGDLDGRWNMLALLYPEANGNTDIQQLLNNALSLSSTDSTCFSLITNPDDEDPTQNFGFFSVPILYRKFGARFEAEITLGWDFLLRVQAGVADIRQTATFVDLTCSATGLTCPVSDCLTPCMQGSMSNNEVTEGSCTPANCCVDVFNCSCKSLVINNIMKEKYKIAHLLDLNIRNFHEIAPEDTRISLIWRHCFEGNFGMCGDWPEFIFTPFAIGEVCAPTGRKKCPNVLFDLPSGNNGHWAYGFDLGFTLDFLETVELGFEGGMTKFHGRLYHNVPVPTHQFQAGMFPRKADLYITPGTNWNFGISLSAWHFLDRLSFWGQFVLVDHTPDCIQFLSSATAKENIRIHKMMEESLWRSMLANVALNYDVSPHLALGFLWQAPIKQYNAYQSTTIMGSLILTW